METTMQKMVKYMSVLVIGALLLVDLSVPTMAQAQLIATDAVIAARAAEANRDRVTAFLKREDVRQVMVEQGVDVAEAERRVASLSDAELAKVAQAMDQLPAGGDGIGAVIGAAVFVFLVLLITDILGFTHVFSFVKPVR
ncbi:MAG: PA2779 family protein [Thermodesulfobacteriota bacterium]